MNKPGKIGPTYRRNPNAAYPSIEILTPDGHIRKLSDFTADVICLAIWHYQGQTSEIARRLGISRSTLYRKMAEMGIHIAT